MENQNDNFQKNKLRKWSVSLILGMSSVLLLTLWLIFDKIGDLFSQFYGPLGVIVGIVAAFLGFKEIKNREFNNKNSAIFGIILGTLWIWPLLFFAVYIGLLATGLIEAKPLFRIF